jgi:hypothetical protein
MKYDERSYSLLFNILMFSDRYHRNETTDLHKKCHFLRVHILEYHSTKFREIPITFATGSNPLKIGMKRIRQHVAK